MINIFILLKVLTLQCLFIVWLTIVIIIQVDTLGSLWQFKRDESPVNNAGNPDNVITTNSSSFRLKSRILGKNNNNGILQNAKIAVPLKYVSSFWRLL